MDLQQITHLFVNPWAAIVAVLAVVVETAPDEWFPRGIRRWVGWLAVLACAPVAVALGYDLAPTLFSAAMGLSGGWLLLEVVEARRPVGKTDEPPPVLIPPPPHQNAIDPDRKSVQDAVHDYLARVAYEAYATARQGTAYDGSLIPGWNAAKPEIQAAWRVAAQAVLEHSISPLEHERVTVRVAGTLSSPEQS
jgi:hypothetical protein